MSKNCPTIGNSDSKWAKLPIAISWKQYYQQEWEEQKDQVTRLDLRRNFGQHVAGT